MNFVYFFVSFGIVFLSNNNSAEAKSENGNIALIYNYEAKKLVEVRRSTDLCQTCLTACPASTEPEKEFDDDDSIAGNSLFIRKTPSDLQNEKNILVQIDTCDRQFEPVIIWDDDKKAHLTGYELYYEEGQIKLQCEEYDNFRQIINGKPSKKQSPTSDFVNRYKKEGNTIFETLDEESNVQKWVFFWIHVLSIRQTEHVRQITLFERDEINNYKPDMTECKDYNLGYGWHTTKIRDDPRSPLDIPMSLISKLSSKNYGLSCEKPDDCLQETQILPMLFFHTLASKLATCTYLNTAFIPETITHNQLKKVDQYLYTMRRIWPNTTTLHFGVSKAKNQQGTYFTYVINSQEIFITEIIFRVIQHIAAGELYLALIVIHTDLTSTPDEDSRICSQVSELEGWEWIKNQNSEAGFTYVCAITEDNIKNLQLPVPHPALDLHLNRFPEYTGNPEAPMTAKDVTGEIGDKLKYFTELGILK